MQKTNFASNQNGKLLCDDFITVRQHDGSYQVGQSREIYLRHQPIGIGEVTEIIRFKMRDLPNIFSFPDSGKDVESLKRFLYKCYSNLHDDSVMDVISIKWTARKMDAQKELFKNFWEKLEEDCQPTLFNR